MDVLFIVNVLGAVTKEWLIVKATYSNKIKALRGDIMTVKELIERLKEFPEDIDVVNTHYCDLRYIYEEAYPYLPENAPEKIRQERFLVIG